MQKLNLKRLDQHAIVAAVIDGLTMVEIVDGLVGLDFQEKVSTGMVLKAMILNGLGCSNRPLTLTAQFFANIPLEHILGPGITAKHFNRHQIGRLLEGLFQYGCTTLFCQISSQAGRLENVERRIQSLDSTSVPPLELTLIGRENCLLSPMASAKTIDQVSSRWWLN